jgi:hypothetical protein
MGRIAALHATGAQQAPLFECGQHCRKELLLGGVHQNPFSEVVQQAEIEAGISQFETEQIFPIQTAAHMIGGLPIGEGFTMLQDQHQGQSPGRNDDRRTHRRKSVRKHGIGEEGARFVAQGQH